MPSSSWIDTPEGHPLRFWGHNYLVGTLISFTETRDFFRASRGLRLINLFYL